MRRRILHDVYENRDQQERCGLDLRAICSGFTGTIIYISQHGDHFQVIHDCSYSKTPCRCNAINELHICNSWSHLAKYLLKVGREMEYIFLSESHCRMKALNRSKFLTYSLADQSPSQLRFAERK